VFMMGYTVEEPPDCNTPDAPDGVLPELSPVEQPATAPAPATPAAAMNLRREMLSESRCGSCVITRNRRKEY